MVRFLLIGVGSLVVAALVWASVVGDVVQLVDGAGWWALAALGFPAFVAVASRRV